MFFVFCVFFLLVKGNDVWVSSVGNDVGDCTNISTPCLTIDYTYSQGTGDEISVHILNYLGFPDSFVCNKSNITHLAGNPGRRRAFYTSEIQLSSTVNPIQSVLLLSISDLIVNFLSSTSTFILFSSGTVQFTNVLVTSDNDDVFSFGSSFIDVSGTGILRLNLLNITNFNNTNKNGLIYIHGSALAIIGNSTFNPSSIVSPGSILQLTDNVTLHATNDSFLLLSQTPTTASVISLDSNLVSVNNVSVFECHFTNFHLSQGKGAVLSILGSSHYSNVLFDDNNVDDVSTTDSDGGGAIVIVDGRGYVRILNNVFDSVYASGSSDGGAVLSTFSGDIYLYNNIFLGVYSHGNVGGGAVSIQNGSLAVVDSNAFYSCNSSANGGAVLSDNLSLGTILYNNTFEECATLGKGNGGAVYIATYWTTYLTYNTFTHNTAAGNGGAVYIFFPPPHEVIPFIQYLLNFFEENAAGGIGYDLAFNTEFIFRPWTTNFITASTSTTVAGTKIAVEDDADLSVDSLLPYPEYHYNRIYVTNSGNEEYPCGETLRNSCGLLEYAFLVSNPTEVSIIHVTDGNYTNASAVAINNRYLLIVGNFDNTIITYTPIEAPYALFSVSSGFLDIENLTFTSYQYYNPTIDVPDDCCNRNLFFVLAEGTLYLLNIHVIPDVNNTVIYGSIINVTGGIIDVENLVLETLVFGNSSAITVRENRHYSHAGDVWQPPLLSVVLSNITAVSIQRLEGNGAVVEGVLYQGNTLDIVQSRFTSVSGNAESGLGGVIYLWLADNFEYGYNFTNLVFQRDSSYLGTAIFINAYSLVETVNRSVFNFDWQSLDDNALVGYASRQPVAINLKSILGGSVEEDQKETGKEEDGERK